MRSSHAAWLAAGLLSLAGVGVGAQTPSRGVGPVKEMTLGPIDPGLVERGRQVFQEKCTACHQIDDAYAGPALRGVTRTRTPEWIMNLILNPEGMLTEDPVAKELLAQYVIRMTVQNVSVDDARAVLEFLRTLEGP